MQYIPFMWHVSFNVAEKSIKAWKMNTCVRQADGYMKKS